MAYTEAQRQAQARYRERNRETLRARSRTAYASNKEKGIARSRKWAEENKPRLLCKKLQDKYGITAAQKAELLASQGGRCAICATDTPSGLGWAVDHCHSTNVIRGILCPHCNTMLGYARDNIQTLQAAIVYLSRGA